MRRIVRFISFFTVLALLSGSGWPENCQAQGKPIAMLLDGYQANCQVVRNGKEPPVFQGMELYDGDVVIKTPDVDDLEIFYYPYARGVKKTKTELLLVFAPPAQKVGLLQKVQPILNFQNQHALYIAASRDGFYSKLKLNMDWFTCGPFPGATLLAGGKTYFYTNDGAGAVVRFYNAAKQELCQVKPEDGMVKLGAGGVMLLPGQNYYWRCGDSGPLLPVTVLRPELESAITDALRQIAAGGGNENAVKLKQVSYLLGISDVYPDQLDLNWLAYQLLREIAFAPELIGAAELRQYECFAGQIYAAEIEYGVD